jgi:hypothetical protein
MGAVTWIVFTVLERVLPGSGLPLQMIRLLATIGSALATLAIVAQLLRIPEFGEARDMVMSRLKRITG